MAFKTKAEKKAFRAGMAKQYNKEHPKFYYALSTKKTVYNADGSLAGKPFYSNVSYYRRKKDAKAQADYSNACAKSDNDFVMKGVRAKNLDVNTSCFTEVTEYKRMKKPTHNVKQWADYSKL